MSTERQREPTDADIAACAYLIFEAEGCPRGRALNHWLQAEAQLTAMLKSEAGETESLDLASLHPTRAALGGDPNAKTE